MFLAVTCQHASGACQSHSRPVLSLREASRKYVELSPSTPPFLTLQFHEKDLMPTPNLRQIRLILPPLGHILSISQSNYAIITNQDKGSLLAMEDTVPLVGGFLCSFHHQQNIIKKCGGGKGSTPLTALWMYNLLASCNSVKQLENNKTKYYDKMHPTNLHYLTKLPDRSKYPAVRCAMGDNICMFLK